MTGADGLVAGLWARLADHLGGPARRRAVLLLAAVLGLDAADKGMVGAIAVSLERSLHVGNTQIGLMVTVSSLVGAAGTLPVGSLVDRRRRVPLLAGSIVVWAVAEAAGAVSPGFTFLLASRVLLGAVTATAGPAVASLTGDLFPGADRGRMYGFILSGEVLGAGVGVVLAELAAAVAGWRAPFVALALPGLALAVVLRRILPEPARGGAGRIEPGATRIRSEGEPAVVSAASAAGRQDTLVLEQVERAGVRPAEEIVTDEDPAQMSLGRAVRYVLSVRTNLILIVASSLGYFFFSGLRTFAVIFLRGRYGVGQGGATALLLVVGVGVLAGLLAVGNYGDRLVRRGRLDGRLLIGTVGLVGAGLTLAPAVASPWLALSLPLFVVAAVCVSGPNPALDAARLDVMPARMWGRAAGVRTVLRQGLEAFAPLLFGVVSEAFGGSRAGFSSGVNLRGAAVSAAQTRGLEDTFLVMLVPVVAGGLILLAARRSYPVDVASAAASDRLVAGPGDEGSAGPGAGRPRAGGERQAGSLEPPRRP